MYVVGTDVGGTTIKCGVTDENGRILSRREIETDGAQPAEDNVRDIAGLCGAAIADAGLSDGDVSGMGMGVPGSVDGNGVISYTCNIRFRNTDFPSLFSAYHPFPVRVANDADCAVLGESVFGGYKGIGNAVMITLGTGVGTGILSDGRLVSGFRGAGGEGGHTVIRAGGVKCGCGRRGCWEAYASATALIRQTKSAMEKHPESLLFEVAREEGKISGRTAFTAAKRGDKTAIALVNRYINYIGEGLVNIVNLVRPEIVFIGGGISNEGEPLIERLQRYTDRYAYGGEYNPRVLIKRATLGKDAGILGAAALCLR